MSRVAIVGGGVSGLSAAYYLGRYGIPCTLIEREHRLGGIVRTERFGDCLVEAGPDSWLAEKSWMLDLVRELGLGDRVIGSNDDRRRTYVVRRGRPRPLPESMRLLAPSRPWQAATSGLLGLASKARMASEWFRRPRTLPERSVAEFVEDHFGREAVEYLAQPLLAGVYGSPPEKLSADSVIPRFVEYERQYGSLLRGVWKNRKRHREAALFLTLREGMGSLTDALQRHLPGTCEVIADEVRVVEPSAAGWRVRAERGEWDASSVIVATPAPEAGRLLTGVDGALAERLGGIVYTSSVVVALVYPQGGFGHPLDGFGLLIPRAERGTLAACTWTNTKFAERAGPGKVLLRAFLAGADADRALESSDESLAGLADAELRQRMGFRPAPEVSRAYRWPAAMPQYSVGHATRVSQIEERLLRFPGLHLAGNGYAGLGIPDCIRRSERIARAIASGEASLTTPAAGPP